MESSGMSILRIAIFFFGSIVMAAGQQDFPLAPPQIASAAGQPAPDLRLKDENSQYVTLSSFRGSRVLLMFFRGYW
jgi:cytochrome oxidase Cu insertion factor (SCO1/SenC/PrrC family)